MNNIFLDTNILVSAIDTTRVNHKKAIELLEKIKKEEFQAYISTQVIGEFYVSLTRSTRGINSPLTSLEAKIEVEKMLSSKLFIVLSVTGNIIKKAVSLCAEKKIKGLKFWDVVIVATMLENEISTIFTENLEDFKKFEDLIKIKSL